MVKLTMAGHTALRLALSWDATLFRVLRASFLDLQNWPVCAQSRDPFSAEVLANGTDVRHFRAISCFGAVAHPTPPEALFVIKLNLHKGTRHTAGPLRPRFQDGRPSIIAAASYRTLRREVRPGPGTLGPSRPQAEAGHWRWSGLGGPGRLPPAAAGACEARPRFPGRGGRGGLRLGGCRGPGPARRITPRRPPGPSTKRVESCEGKLAFRPFCVSV